MIDQRLREFATQTQLTYLNAVEEHGSGRAAARALGIAASAVNDALARLKANAARQGYSPDHGMVHTVPDGYKVKGVSTLYNRDGVAVSQWVKSSADEQRQRELMEAAYKALSDELPRQEPISGPIATCEHLANLYTLTDSHVGALCWHRENLESDWDLGIAERTLTACFEQMVKSSPKAKVGIVAQLGDFLHTDGLAALTPTSGHVLDADGRFPKIVESAVRILRRVVNFALARHEKVIVLMAEGNHDMAASVWLRTMFQALYENEPRVEVVNSVLPYYVYQHGKTMLAWHHGHLKRNDDLPLLFAAQFPEMWGQTKKRYAHCGHRHHVEVKEHSGITVVQHSTLAARDAYASRGGWMSERQCTAMTYHTEYGQVGTVTITPEMVES